MLWILTVALASDRWVEHDTRLRRAWIAGQDEVARAWPGDRVEAVARWTAAWRASRSPAPRLADHHDGATLWVGYRSAGDRDDPRRSEWTEEVLVQRAGEAPVAVDVGEAEHPLCANVLLDGRAVVGRSRPLEPGEPLDRPRTCVLYAVDLATLAVSPFDEGPRAWVVDGPAGATWTLSGEKRMTVVARGADGAELDRWRWWRRRSLNGTADGHFVAWRGPRVWYGEDPARLKRHARLAGDAQLLSVDADEVWMRTDARVAGGEVVALEVDRPGPERWRARVAERPGSDLVGAWRHVDRVFQAWSRDGVVGLEVQPVDGGPSRPVALGGPWTGLTMSRTWDSQGAVLKAYSPLGWRAWRVDGVDADGMPRLALLGEDLREDLVLETLRLPAGGSEVPVTLIRRAGAAPDGAGALWAYVYGGFGQSQAAWLDESRELFLAAGGAVAVIHARGGRERGEAWHEDAIEANLGRAAADVTAAVRGLIDLGWAAEGRVALQGVSNGGLTVAAALRDAPSLYGAAVASAGVMDLVNGARWRGYWWPSEYGRPRGDQRQVLMALSPRHHPPDVLPPTLIITGDHDPVVPPRHSYTLAAAWDTRPGGPLLLRVDRHGTHGGRKRERDDRVRSEERGAGSHTAAFLLRALEVEVPEGPGR